MLPFIVKRSCDLKMTQYGLLFFIYFPWSYKEKLKSTAFIKPTMRSLVLRISHSDNN